jgi:single-strand DNA-binding protein
MSSVNKVILIGRLGKDPELRFTQSGTPVARLSVATDESYKDKEGNKVQRTEWHNVIVWNQLATVAGDFLLKGRQAYFEGKLQTREWEDQDGNRRVSTEIVARHLVLLGSKEEQNKAETPSTRPEGKASPPKAPVPKSGKASGVEEPEDYLGVPEEDIPF